MQGTPVTDRYLLRRRNSLSSSLQAGFDAFAIIALIYVHSLSMFGELTMPYLLMTMLLLTSMAIIYDRLSIYRSYGGLSRKALQLAKAWGLSFLLLLFIGFASKQSELFSRVYMTSLFISGYAVQLAGYFIFRYLQNINTSYHPNAKALVIGSGHLADRLYERINQNPWIHETIIGALKISETVERRSDVRRSSIPILGQIDDLDSVIKEQAVQTVYVAVPLENSSILKAVYIHLLDANLDIHWIPDIFAMNLINYSVKEIAGLPIHTLSESPMVGSDLLFKNLEDKVIASIALILLSPIMLVTALMIKLESKGPVFFRQDRTGWDGEVFKIWKFRSMSIDQPDSGEKIVQATLDDVRITAVGSFIRKTSLDELPQLFNVLSGQMSLVGPRPHAVQHNDEYAQRITAYLARLRIKPGITGLAQVRGCRGETKKLSLMQKRIEYDLEYINKWSLWTDLTIMARTVNTLFNKNVY